jgi:acylphosphatase
MSGKSLPERRDIHYSGHVQGVGFRFTTRAVAARFDVAGWVQNLPDGRVQVVVEGKPAELDLFQQAIAEAMRGHIDQTEVETKPALGGLAGFEIRH